LVAQMTASEPDLVDLAEALRARDGAFDMLERTRKMYLIQARAIASRLYRETGLPVSVDDVRKVYPPPDGVDGRLMGVVFRKGWRVAEEIKSARKTCHARPIKAFIPISEGGSA
jgi:hypothetical protein